ncbi:MAG TPA: PHP domain-containing protein, partial [Candidatus Nitrosotenuis sp.]|nr:PHP domain-containing protein [Candidatus Nitrosotenuis sp.]
MFVHLHCHSHYSFLRAVPSPEEIIAAAEAQARTEGAALPESLRGGAVALTDTNGLYAAVPFVQKARAAGVKPIVGAVLDIQWPVVSGQWPAMKTETRSRDLGIETRETANNGKLEAALTWTGPRLVLLAQNHEGYSNLCRLVTRRHLGGEPVGLETLNEYREGLIALYPCDPSASLRASQRLAISDQRTGTPWRAPTTDIGGVARLKEIFGDALYLEAHSFRSGMTHRRQDGGGTGNLREASRLAREFGVPLAATNNVHFLAPEEHLHHRVLNAIRTGTLLTKIAPPEIAHAEAYFKSTEEMHRAFADFPEALTATLDIAARCNLELELGKTIFPECTVPEGETPFSYLWKLCFDGARRRYRPLRPEVLARLTRELEIIDKLHLAPYFLLVWEIVEEARRRNIPAVARGSAASSMVTYCLGISRVCPLRWGLYFERFLNEERSDVPDIDIDICGARRDELLEWVYQRWGTEHV